LRGVRRAIAIALVVIAGGALLFGAVWFGAYTYAFNKWPATQFQSLKPTAIQSSKATGIEYDSYGRLFAYPGKTEIACPSQTERSAVILVIGQSNAANTGGQRFKSQTARVADYANGKCTIAASPLLGNSAAAGEPWTAVGDGLVSHGDFDNVVLIPAAIGGSGLAEWIGRGQLRPMLQDVVQDAQRHYRITHVLWHQGETDFAVGTSEESYLAGLKSLASELRGWGVAAPIYVSIATRCDPIDVHWVPDNAISRAQRRLGNSGEGFAPGIDTDALLDGLDRHDGCHMAGSGLTKAIDAWTQILRGKPAGD
jgi:hypothetical protein